MKRLDTKGAFGSFAGEGPALPSEDSRAVNAFGCFASCFGFRASNATVERPIGSPERASSSFLAPRARPG